MLLPRIRTELFHNMIWNVVPSSSFDVIGTGGNPWDENVALAASVQDHAGIVRLSHDILEDEFEGMH